MRYRVKVVPKAEPNADGEWIEVEVKGPVAEHLGWNVMAATFEQAGALPETHFMVQVARLEPHAPIDRFAGLDLDAR